MSPRHHPSDDILDRLRRRRARARLRPGRRRARRELRALPRRASARSKRRRAPRCKTCREADVGADALAKVMARLGRSRRRRPSRRHAAVLERLPLKPKQMGRAGRLGCRRETPHAPNNRVYLLSVAAGDADGAARALGRGVLHGAEGRLSRRTRPVRRRRFRRGRREFNHQPIVQGDETCVCLFATEGPAEGARPARAHRRSLTLTCEFVASSASRLAVT